ncbi:MAG: DUF6252 family protein [Polaribacter sp.]|nr:DUF6252 family protein [Polaribacter sp.]
MKRTLYFLFVLSFVFIINSCQENGIFFPPSENSGVFEVTIDGVLFTSSKVSFVNDDNTLILTAVKSETDETLTLVVEDFRIGSFSFEGVNNVASYIQSDLISSKVWTTFGETSSRGNIVFTDIDYVENTVSGTFSFIGKNGLAGSSKAFSNGTFTKIIRSDIPVSQDNFKAKVDGVSFEDTTLFSNSITLGNKDYIRITANKTMTEAIDLTLSADIIPGEYDLGSLSAYPAALYNINGESFDGLGKLVVLSHDTTAKRITGTFNFEAISLTSGISSYDISEGEFSVSY